LNNALEQGKNDVESLNQRVQKLTEELSAVRLRLTDEQRLRSQLQTDLAQTNTAREQIEQNMQLEVQSIKATSAELEQELEQEVQSIKATSAELEQELELEVQSIKATRAELKQELEQEVQSIKVTSAELEQELKQELQRQLSLQEKLNAEMDLVSNEKSELQASLEDEQENQRRLQQQINRVMGDVGLKEVALADEKQQAARLSTQLSQTREERALLENRVEQLNQQREMDARHFAELEDRLKNELNESRIEISQFKNQMTVIKLTSEVLFNSGSAKIQPNGLKVLAVIAESLNAFPERAISIEGHTDNVRIGKRSSYASNWELSAARALAAVNFFQQDNQVDPQRLQVVGHGEFQPVSSNETVEGRQRNRRIEIRLMPEAQVSAEQ
jgi:chemotaxis protein MotB